MKKLLFAIYRWPAQIAFVLHSKKMRSRCQAKKSSLLYPSCIINNPQSNRNAISIGEYTVVLGQLLVLTHSGKISVGDCSYVADNTKIWSGNSISIGDRVFISFGVNIHDYDAHSISAKNRHEQFKDIFITGRLLPLGDIKSKPIVIEDDAWVGFNASILKGVTIGRGAIVAAGAVVTHDVEPFTIVAGNPARTVGKASE
ncbi:acyltransferase [Sediminibacterium roseum]|uniref:Acyltransferase n=1 Tax=Sediminibacterium roseum TaxID=1978412 RepID=A0ABW9ZPR2_9BACT|nr:acyltransferase [Sediminibacterium roseum]NCI49091.1 acyltransferase [Sediminibacterium roseum]